MKQCSKCLRWLDLEAFARNRTRRDGLQNNCRECQRAYVREHYLANRAYYIAKAHRSKRKYERAMRARLNELKDVACADCGQRFKPWVMDFDHVDGEKLFNLARTRGRSLRVILLEVAKCQIVCANCHRDRTHQRRNHAPIAQPG